MTKKFLAVILVFMIVLSMGTVSANVHNNEKQEPNDVQVNKLTESSNELITNDDIKTDVEENIKHETVNSGNKQYTVTEAPEPIIPVEEKSDKRVIYPDKPMIAITYDDGPSVYTPEVLDILKENNSVATFFVLGSRVYDNNDTLNRMLEEGNQIGNHSYNHKNLTTISDEELYKQIKGTDDLVYIATGYTPSVMRPPYGSTNKELIQKISKPVIKWSVDTRDWENRNVEMINKNIFENVKDGDIILMHDLYESTLEASKIAIPELISRGFQIVTIDELFEYRGASLAAGEQYYNVYK
jgi:peptidoglycan/xylan/chitin deacetylase (PgdA/CDA1 family)